MNPFLDYDTTLGREEFPLPSNIGDGDEKIRMIDLIWTQPGNKGQFRRPSLHPERNIPIPRDGLDGTNPSEVPIPMDRIATFFSEINRLRGLYRFQQPEQVKEFLGKNNTLLKMISSTYDAIRREFPTENLILEAISDSPNSNDKEIVISVSTSLPVNEAIERLDRVENIKWNKDSKDPYIDVCVKLEYQ
jgi:hypothetical protein